MKESIDDIYKAYFNEVYRFLLSLCYDHYTAEDIVQETFFRAYLYLENYDGESVKTWLFTVAHHAFVDYYRKQKRMLIKEESYFSAVVDKKRLPVESMLLQEKMQEHLELLKDLPKKYKSAVLLRDFHEFSYDEAAEIMNVTKSHYKVLLFRGRQAIRKRRAERN